MSGGRSLSRKWMAIESDPESVWLSYLSSALEECEGFIYEKMFSWAILIDGGKMI